MAVFAKLNASVEHYAKGKLWYWHVPLWLFGLYLFVKLLGFNLIDPQPFALSVMHSFDFMLHEFAHVFTAWLPPLVTAAAGSGSELLLGLLLVYGAFQFRNYFASLFCCLWFMLVCMSVGHYMADAVPQAIPLVSLGGAISGSDNVVHDWHFIFKELGLLDSSAFIGGSLRALGIAVGLFGVVFSAWAMYKMATAKGAQDSTDAEKLLLKTTNVQGGIRQSGHGSAAASQGKVPIYPDPIRGTLSHPSPTEHSDGPKKPLG